MGYAYDFHLTACLRRSPHPFGVRVRGRTESPVRHAEGFERDGVSFAELRAARGRGRHARCPGAIPGLPPEIQQWIQQGAQALPQLIPPGLIPPGLIPGAPTTPAAPAQPTEPRFHGFRILSQTQVMDRAQGEARRDPRRRR